MLHRLIVLLPLGCGIQTVGELETADGGGDAEGGSTSLATATTPATTTENPSTASQSGTSLDPTTDTGDDSGSTTESCVGPNNCGPVTVDQNATFRIIESFSNSLVIAAPCLINDVSPQTGHHRIELDCTIDAVAETVVIEADLQELTLLNVFPGRDVLFDRGDESAEWGPLQWFVLRSADGGQLLLAGNDRPTVTIPLDSGEGFAPFFPAVNDEDCGVDPCLEDSCYFPQQTAIEFPFEGDPNIVPGGTELFTGATTRYRIRVQESKLHHDVMCEDVPNASHIFLIEDVSEG